MTELREDHAAFAELVEPHQPELHAYCYRMLGSVQDADDALQETMLRAWRGLAGLRTRDASRGWLYTIAHNVCLTEIERRSRRMLPHDFAPAAEPHTPPGEPVVESVWIEPYPDRELAGGDRSAAPEARYEQLESIELAFVAALQHLAPNQRAVLILRDVLGFSAREVAGMLATSVASVTSALQRAREAVRQRVPSRTQQETVRSLGDPALQRLVQRYTQAWERCDVAAFTALLTEDATFAMPPLSTWYRTRETIATWAREFSLSGAWKWRTALTRANGQIALGFYSLDEQAQAHLPFALNVLTLRGDLVSDVTAFIVRATTSEDPEAYVRFPEQPMDRRRLGVSFGRFGLPDQL